MKKIVLVFPAVALLAGCGSSGNAALSKTFSYGAPQAPSAAEQAAATSAQSSLSDAAAFSAAPDGTRGSSVVAFVDQLASAALGAAPVGIAAPAPAATRAMVSSAFTSDCTKVAGDTVTFTNCVETDSGFTLTLSGSITANAGTVSWNISGGFSGSNTGVSINLTVHQAGSMTVTASTIKGHGTSDFAGNASGNGQSASFGLSTAAVVDLAYQAAPAYCVTSGTMEVKRVWTERPQGATGPDFADAGVKLSWTGCETYTVAHSQ
ncbi:MAG TPA: hypothetical protein VI356_08230 [Myxococcales bacterium]